MASGTFEGTSNRGDINRAIQDAIANAKDSFGSSYVRWKLEEVRGENGGVTKVNDLTVTISAEA